MPIRSSSRFLHSPISSTPILAFGFVLIATPALAGFQWIPPEERSANASSVETYALPPAPSPKATTMLPEIISPVIISGTSAPAPAASPLPSAAPSLVVPISSGKPASVEPATPVLPTPPAPLAPVKTPVQAAPPMPELPPAPVVAPSAPVPPPAPKTVAEPVSDLSTATISIAPSMADQSPAVGVVQGFASRIPLALALRQLLPVGYSFSIDPGVDMNTLVSYKGGKPWGETLNTMLASVGLKYQEHNTVITVSRLALPAPKALEPTPMPTQPKAVPVQGAKPNTTFLTPPISSLPTLSAPSELPTMNVPPVEGWSAERGDTLRKVLGDWCKRGGVELQWKAEYDYPIEASAHFRGDFENAVRNLLSGFDGARPQPVGELYANAGAAQKVLVIQARGNSYSN